MSLYTSTTEEQKKMYRYLTNDMPLNKWMPVQTDKAFDAILSLLKLDKIYTQIEFNNEQTAIKRIDNDIKQPKNFPDVH